MTRRWITVATIGCAVIGGLAFVQSQGGPAADTEPQPAVPAGQVQPIQFPHDVHAGTYQMDCQYCHFSAERSIDAGMPSVESCMGCHRIVAGTTEQQQAEIAKVRDYANRGEPIPWVRIYKVPDHVHYPHMRHVVNAGLQCQECHGTVEEMGPIVQQDPLWGGRNMGWCVSCHVEQDASRDCTVCHY